jgi:hypothetical protein
VDKVRKYTSIALGKNSHDILMALKHKLERETGKSWSFGRVIEYLCKHYEDR